MKTVYRATALSLALTLSLGGGLALAHERADKPTLAATIDDGATTAAIKTRLIADERAEGFDINVDTDNGHVTLRGGADSLADRMAAERIAWEVDGVVAVDNQIVIAADGTEARMEANEATASGELREGGRNVAEAVGDGWITTKVKTQLLADDDVKGLKIDVDTKDTVDFLTGTVENRSQRAQAITIANNTRGVTRVRADQLIIR